MGLFSRKQKLGELPIEQTRFSGSDIFALLDGADTGQLACPLDELPYSEEEGIPLSRFKKHLIDTFSETGFVDKAGKPCEELERILYPLAKPGVLLSDGEGPSPNAGKRNWTITIFDGIASAIVRAPGRNKGYFLKSLGDSSQWDQKFKELARIEGVFTYNEHDMTVLCNMSQFQALTQAMNKADESSIAREAVLIGCDSTPLVKLARRQSRHADAGFQMTAIDYSSCAFAEHGGVTIPIAVQGNYRMRTIFLLPKQGVAFGPCLAPKPDDPEQLNDAGTDLSPERMIGRFDFIGSGEVLNRIAQLDWYPDHFGEQTSDGKGVA